MEGEKEIKKRVVDVPVDDVAIDIECMEEKDGGRKNKQVPFCYFFC